MTYLAERPARLAWYNPFVRLQTSADAKRAVQFGAGVTLAIQGLGLIVMLLRTGILLQHSVAKPAANSAGMTLAAILAVALLLVVMGVALYRWQKLWAAVALVAIIALGQVAQLGHWITLIRLPNLMSLSGSIMCLRGVLALRRGMPDLDVFS